VFQIIASILIVNNFQIHHSCVDKSRQAATNVLERSNKMISITSVSIQIFDIATVASGRVDHKEGKCQRNLICFEKLILKLA